MLKKLSKVFAVVFTMFFLASFVFFKKEAIACELIGLTHFTEASSNLYVDESISTQPQNRLTAIVQEAVDRVTRTYGAPTSEPRIIATADTYYAKLGFNPTGMQSSGFFRECIFLGPKGLNTDVVAHELVHAEVRHRTSLWVELTQLPAWFIEGTGIKVDYRHPFLIENMNVTNDDLTKIKSVFFLSDFPNTNVKYYQASLIAVAPMDPKSMYAGLDKLNKGGAIQRCFRRIVLNLELPLR